MAPTSPSTELYSLGRGILSVGAWSGDTPPVSLTDVGAVPEFALTVTEEKLEHKSYRSGIRVKDKVVVLESGYEGTFSCDEISLANLVIFFKGELSGNVVKVNQALNKEYAMQFIETSEVGEKYRWTFHKCYLGPNGDFGLISDTWAQLKYKFEGLLDTANHADSPFFDIEMLTTTT